ncbi:hypothetical protein [Aquabacterium sp.]|nr:hypothetical protein [Aquabacterium sp.]MDI1259337.1 hypothetical protein [Aquabacterium sp.]
MRKKLLQNTLFAAMAAWAIYGLHTAAETAVVDARWASTMVAFQQ